MPLFDLKTGKCIGMPNNRGSMVFDFNKKSGRVTIHDTSDFYGWTRKEKTEFLKTVIQWNEKTKKSEVTYEKVPEIFDKYEFTDKEMKEMRAEKNPALQKFLDEELPKRILEMLKDDELLQAERKKANSDEKSKWRGYDKYDDQLLGNEIFLFFQQLSGPRNPFVHQEI
ncbi:Protein CBG26834 [Caenorhabditis briggsae]|uniref:Protein CBG26834 n=1 Tax=Caenorhabditis briggsae TaxID=6238 RepID=B6IKQ4_CAEBR|nr:Protein CBG26834 [Caenorhabditis briggsae]CAS00484.1 Protein CBG26834 [Caenorhabditis briggsae]